MRREQWQMRAPFHITGYVFTELDCLVVELAQDGCIGRGEAAGVYYLNDTVQSAIEQAAAIASELARGLDRSGLQQALPPGGARNAIDCALWDLECKLASQSIWQRTGLKPRPLQTCQTVGVQASIEETAAVAAAFADCKLIKVKLTSDRPIERVRAVRAARPDARLIVDANQGLSLAQLQECLPEFAKCEVEMVEQPLPRGEDAGLEGLARAVPICADESCLHRGDLDAAAKRYDMINIKLDKTGGLTEALLLADAALTRGLDVMVGNMLGTSLAMAPAFVVGLKSKIVDLDGPLALKWDRIDALKYAQGCAEPFAKELWG